MFKSEDITELAKALCVAQTKIPSALKNKENPHFRNKYADINTLLETCLPVLSENGLSIVQTFEPSGEGLTIETILIHRSGQYLGGSMYLPLEKKTPQGIGSATTYGRRYGLAAILGMVSDDDDDGQAAEPGPAKPPKASDTQPTANTASLL